jgi:anti-sigma factor RsiW
MNCTETHPLLHAYADGELDLMRSLDVERHLGTCAACAAARQSLLSLRTLLRQSDLAYRAPQLLRDRLRYAVALPGNEAQPRRRESRPWPWQWLAAWAAAAALLVLLLRPAGVSVNERLTDDVIAGHVRSLMAGHLTDVASSDQHTVKPWFNGKLPFSPLTIDLEAGGFPLVGGRLDYLENHAVAALVYQHRKHLINLFTWPSSRIASTAEDFRTHQGYNVIHWSQGDMEYQAVSDMNQGDLRDFARLLRSGSSPPSPP